MEQYRSGHNEADSKSVSLSRPVGSNPTCSAKQNALCLFRAKSVSFRLLLFYQLLLISKNTKAALIKSQMLQFTREHSSSPLYSRNLPGGTSVMAPTTKPIAIILMARMTFAQSMPKDPKRNEDLLRSFSFLVVPAYSIEEDIFDLFILAVRDITTKTYFIINVPQRPLVDQVSIYIIIPPTII